MARPLRIQLPGLSYHVHARGNGRMDIFRDDCDRLKFLELLSDVIAKFDIECHAYCMMTNHSHLVITTPDANLSRAIHDLDGAYAQWWNRRHERVGHLYQGRFGAKVVQDDAYLLTACKYVVWNPVRKGLAESPEQWRWSSHRASAGLEPVPPFLHPQTLWRLLGADDVSASVFRYRAFTATRNDDDRRLLEPPIVGDDEFVRRFDGLRQRASREVPRRERQERPALESLFARAVTRADRDTRTVGAHAAGYSMQEIASYLGLHRTTVGKVIAAATGRVRCE